MPCKTGKKVGFQAPRNVLWLPAAAIAAQGGRPFVAYPKRPVALLVTATRT